ncbi:hypothetical protein [Enterococcus hulanensis]|uniref:hypothetical protein n=1 Tax=Enterococcus hulanensis TaxID=2559929 RepID=UPI0014856446|nr:hypothetical protein [Enterococcus hulanensis]
MKKLNTNQLNSKNSKIHNFMKCVTITFGVALILNMLVPGYAFADIESSMTTAGNTVFDTIVNVSGAVGLAIIGIGWFGNMIPMIEISQKAKMIIIKVGVSIVGLAFSKHLIAWFQGMN